MLAQMATASAATGADAAARILAAVRAIAPGQVAGYGEVARRAGLPGRARLAARVLAGNDDPTLPWHRVLRADGRIAFPPGSAGGTRFMSPPSPTFYLFSPWSAFSLPR